MHVLTQSELQQAVPVILRVPHGTLSTLAHVDVNAR